MKVQLNGSKASTLHDPKQLVSILIPVYNEAPILQGNLNQIFNFLKKIETRYVWEVIIVNDGSDDKTGQIAEEMVALHDNAMVVHHKTNKNLGSALRSGFNYCTGYFIIVLDIDLSYAPEHIERMLDKAQETEADIVVVSPYMDGGKTTEVPFLRLLLSKTINRLIRMVSQVNIHTYTGMVRLYKRSLIKNLNLKSLDYSINPEIIQKAGILRAKVVEIPGHLDWSTLNKTKNRNSSLKIYNGIVSGLMSSFIFRPYAFFMIIGGFLFLLAAYFMIDILANTFTSYNEMGVTNDQFGKNITRAITSVFKERPHAFIVGSTALIIALQFLSLSFLSLQSKRYFDEIFNLSSKVLKNQLIYAENGLKDDEFIREDETTDPVSVDIRIQKRKLQL